MSDNNKKYDRKLREIAESLDLTPTQHMRAVKSYKAVGEWLDTRYEGVAGKVEISPQGSFLLGTMTKPPKNSKNPAYDIDSVCLLPAEKGRTTPTKIKKMVGDRLKEHDKYKEMLDDEGRRCWTLDYAEDGAGVAFNLDVLPCVPEDKGLIEQIHRAGILPELAKTAVAITNRESIGSNALFSWSTSNPAGYGSWFSLKNSTALKTILDGGRRFIFEAHKGLFSSVDEVPSQLVKTSLQRAIQLLKRHRDVRFSGRTDEGDKPISMIITTIAAHLYRGEQDVVTTLQNFIAQLQPREDMLTHPQFAGTGLLMPNLIFRKPDGEWYIGNPVNPAENFADRWHENGDAKARAFFRWVSWLRQDMAELTRHIAPDEITATADRMLGLDLPPARPAKSSLILPGAVQDNVPHIDIGAVRTNKPWANKE